MDGSLWLLLLSAVASFGAGILVGRGIAGRASQQQIQALRTREADISQREEQVEEKKKHLVKEAEISAENIKKEKIYEAKEKFLKLKSAFEEESAGQPNGDGRESPCTAALQDCPCDRPF